MIRTEREYRKTLRDLAESRDHVAEYRSALEAQGLDEAAIRRVITPMVATQSQAESEIAEYEAAQRVEIGGFRFGELGRYLIKLRIARGWSPRELANALEVDEGLISRDEKNEYQGITKERVQRILDALEVDAYVTPIFRNLPTVQQLASVPSARARPTVVHTNEAAAFVTSQQFPVDARDRPVLQSLLDNSVSGSSMLTATTQVQSPVEVAQVPMHLFPGIGTPRRDNQRDMSW